MKKQLGIFFTWVLISITTSVFAIPLSGIYYIGVTNTNYAGAKQFTTLKNAMDSLVMLGASGPVTFVLVDNNYNEQPIYVSQVSGLNQSSPLLIKPFPGTNPVVILAPTTTYTAGFTFSDADWIHIDGSSSGTDPFSKNLTFKLNGVADCAVFKLTYTMNGAQHNIIRNCIIENNQNVSSFNVGVDLYGDSVNYNTISNNVIYKQYTGIRMEAGMNAHHNVVDSNIIGSFTIGGEIKYAGMYISRNNYSRVGYNTIQNVTSSSGGIYGIYSNYSDSLTFIGNVISDIVSTASISTLACGFYHYSNLNNPRLTLINNMISHVASISGSSIGNSVSGIFYNSNATSPTPASVRMINNTVHLSRDTINGMGVANAASIGVIIQTTGANQVIFRNNLIYNGLGMRSGFVGVPFGFSIYASHYDSPFTQIDNNQYFTETYIDSNYVGFFNAPVDFSTWKTVISGDVNGLHQKPLFLSPSDGHIAPSEFLMCPQHPWVSIDIDQQLRTDPTHVGADDIFPLYGTYTIGGTNPNFPTITEAVDALMHNGVSSGVQFNIRAGSYNERVELGKVYISNPNDSIVFTSENNDSLSVTITYTPTDSMSNYLVLLDGTDRVHFKKLSFNNSSSFSRIFFFNAGVTNVSVRNCFINGNFSSTNVTQGSLIYFNQRGPEIDSNIVFYNNYLRNGSWGVLWSCLSTSKTRNLNFSFNVFNDQTLGGAIVQQADHPYFFANRFDAGYNSVQYYGIKLIDCVNYPEIRNNKYLSGSNTQNQTAFMVQNFNGTPSFDVYFINNVIKLKSISGTHNIFGIVLNQCNYVKLYHNTIRISGNNNTTSCLSINGGSNIVSMNSIYSNEAQGKAYTITGSPANFNSQKNCIYSSGIPLVTYDASVYNTFADWQGGGLDANSFGHFPKFTGPAGFHLNDGLLNMQGNYLGPNAIDFEGQARNASFPDIGADEFVPVDLGNDTSLCATSYILATPGGLTYLWNTGATTNSINANSNGTYSVLVTESVGGATGSDTVNVQLFPFPVVSAGSDQNVCAGQSTTLSASGANTYVWSDGLGYAASVSISPVGSHVYTVTGSNSFGCFATDDVAINVTPLPTADAGAPLSANAGQWISIIASASDYYSIDWITLGDGVFSSTTTINTSYLPGSNDVANGYVQLVLKAQSSCGVSNDTLELFITSNCHAEFDPTPFGTNQLSLHNISSGYWQKALWDMGDGVFSNDTSTIWEYQYAWGGYRTVCLTVYDTIGHCQDDTCITVLIGSPATPCNSDFTWAETATNTISFTSTSVGSLTNYYWQFGDGNVDYIANPTHVFSQSGIYNVTLVVSDTNNECTNAKTITITVGNPANDCHADFTFYSDLSTNRVVFVDRSMGSNLDNYVWNFGDNSIPTQSGTFADYTYTESGFYDVCLLVSSSVTGCQNITCKMVRAGDDQQSCYADFIYVVDTTNVNKSATQPVKFKGTAFGDPAKTNWECLWEFGDNDTAMNNMNPLHYYQSNDAFLVSFKVTYGTCVSYAFRLVNLTTGTNQLLGAFGYVFDTTGTKANQKPIKFKGTAFGDPARIAWDFGDGTGDTTTYTPTHLYDTGSYFVCFIVEDPLTGRYDSYCDTLRVTDSTTVGVFEIKESSSLNVFPNPSQEKVFVNYTLNTQTSLIIVVYDETGREVRKNQFLKQQKGSYQIEYENLSSGIYSIRLETESSSHIRKFVVLR